MRAANTLEDIIFHSEICLLPRTNARRQYLLHPDAKNAHVDIGTFPLDKKLSTLQNAIYALANTNKIPDIVEGSIQ